MAALYAFCRQVDDIADETNQSVEERKKALAEWRNDIATIYSGGKPRFAVNRELQRVVHQFALPKELFDELLNGVGMDLDQQRYQTQQDLELYCYRVASVVGLLSIEIFGYCNSVCKEYAVFLGKALQLTNILRDVRIDADRGRIYFPTESLHRFDVAPEEILEHKYTDRFRALAAETARRAREFYRKANDCLPTTDRPSMIAAELMGAVYWRLLLKMERTGFDCFGPECPRLPKLEKLYLVFRTWWRIRTRSSLPNYGLP